MNKVFNDADNDNNLMLAEILQAKDLGYKYIVIAYEGAGDSGSIDYVGYSNEVEIDYYNQINHEPIPTGNGVLENWAYKVLNNVSDWYNNEGGFGTIILDLYANTYTINNNVRITNIEEEEYTDNII
jgi:hypothetical protein